MTEDQIERSVARKFDTLDAFFMDDGSPMVQAEYDAAAAEITQWAEQQYVLLALSERVLR